MKRITELELRVLRATEAGDPWEGVRGVGSRRASQALNRLQKKGLVEYVDYDCLGWLVTDEGRKFL